MAAFSVLSLARALHAARAAKEARAHQRGRPPKKRQPHSLLDPAPPRRRKKAAPTHRKRRTWDRAALLALVDERVKQAKAAGREIRRGTALCEVFAEEMARREPEKFARFHRYRLWCVRDGRSESSAIRRALEKVAKSHLALLERQLSYAVKGRQRR